MNNRKKPVVLAPGPVHLHSSVLEAVEPVHHRSCRFRELVRDTEHSLKELLHTVNPVYMVTSSGTGVMEAAVANVTSGGMKVMVIAGGKFGKRWEELCRVYGCRVETVYFEPGDRFDIERIMKRIREFSPEAITVTHVESSSGTLFPLEEFAKSLTVERPVLIVDAIASLGVEELEMDAWGIDVVISAAQKALAAPPGISMITMNERAADISRKCSRPLYYFSAERYRAGCQDGDTPFTPAIQAVQILNHTLGIQKKVGWKRMRERHRRSSMALTASCRKLGLRQFSSQPAISVQALKVPDGCDSVRLIEKLSAGYGVVIAGGQAELRGKIVRIGYTGLYSGDTLALAVRGIGEVLAGERFEVDIEGALSEIAPLRRQKDIF